MNVLLGLAKFEHIAGALAYFSKGVHVGKVARELETRSQKRHKMLRSFELQGAPIDSRWSLPIAF